ncbi:hypothetical protein [Pseudomonas auratipiscis]|uniref:Uncharacterized protein n=1 Tax=Pseudomonas auratipiscis TaxID=3115853 RepID=A0AB35WMA5_9PSED|nr:MULTISPECIES: hypothetical protein [unclassified Pseudomonas]MEE1864933.1 hypothetical protein [Pseudomonas sp. 120P]MEE1956126.1 hypothetical protein [Pseudomonas sp. 119P]
MTPNDPKHDDKVPRPLSSEEAQQGGQVRGPVLEHPDPDTEAVDKVITPTSIKEKEEETREIERNLAEVEDKARR